MEDAPRQTLEQWLVEAMTDEEQGGEISAITLWIVDVMGEPIKEIHGVRFGPKTWGDKELAELFRTKARNFCLDPDTPNTFMLQAFYGKDTQPKAFYPFRTRATSDGKFRIMTEPPTETGQLKQTMRIMEVLVKGAFQQQATMMDMQLRHSEMLTRHNAQLTEESRKKDEVIFEMGFRQSTLIHQQKMEELKAARNAEMVSKGLELAPAFLQQITGRQVLPESTVDSSLMKAIASSLTEENVPILVQSLASVLDEQTIGLLVTRFGDILKDKKRREEDGKTLLKVVKPDDDVAGGKGE